MHYCKNEVEHLTALSLSLSTRGFWKVLIFQADAAAAARACETLVRAS